MSNKQTSQIIFVCDDCGDEFAKWQGKCPNCGAWNTLKEFKTQRQKTKPLEDLEVVKLSEVKSENFQRISTSFIEVDRVLGGGLVPGSLILLGGEPGIGKSTLLLQLAEKMSGTFYVSGEESAEQIKMRADRLKLGSKEINFIAETDVDSIISTLLKQKPSLVIIDSVQTMYSENFPSTAGSIVQVRETALRLQKYAKENHVPVVLVGHVTKDGTVAGPKTLEHMVDVVLYLEGERFHDLRILRTTKNRFGATDEIGIFEITGLGLKEVSNPSKVFLAEESANLPGSVITVTVEGTRPLLVEIQALVSESSFGYPKRTASGFDLNRLQLIVAILVNRGGLNLNSTDVYLNVAGGFRLKEPAADLAVAIAIASAYKNKNVEKNTVFFGELGLGGEVRPVNFESKRLSEAKRLGYKQTIQNKLISKVLKEAFNV
ncbi:TPA: DNA repair protein RadA [Candidatus Berkelbacteria bacterium]|uniref:DNA repair protein RadA n=1 Tax=Berkelbacteria bacterium GW2011_GWE1_39_12 TaxID=1618337 RepID=A0A0G4B259_9BACT|nr:MAG: repair protein RadA, DNA repair protein RadA/Sms protein [Berkelbacteria bacterium GW2011_GWE1_39_12]HBO60496.1 DNA repair protein RadA [Candidatus Berkelbacteria bacterium]